MGAILAVGFSQLVVAGAMSSIAVALPLIRTEFGVSEAATAWVLLAYALPVGAVAIAAGRLADRADLRAVAVFSMAALTVASVAAALAPSFGLLLAARAVGGLLGGLLFGMTGRIVVTSSSPEHRGRAMSAIALMMTVGGMGMVGAGGFVVAAFDWQGLFWVFAAMGAAAVAAVAVAVPSNGTGLPRPTGRSWSTRPPRAARSRRSCWRSSTWTPRRGSRRARSRSACSWRPRGCASRRRPPRWGCCGRRSWAGRC
nr:hypothetical protein GCM10025732_06830 [Glycomyces mayteni]